MEIVIKPYHALPCELQEFEINGIRADKKEFGESGDYDIANAEEYGCGCYRFVANRRYTQEILDKYNITPFEYQDICDKLEKELFVGQCGWCK